MADETKVFDVDRLGATVAGYITVNKRRHDVLQIKGRQQQSLRSATGRQYTERLYQVVAEVAPTLTPEEVGELNVDQANAIMGVSGAGVEAIEALYPPNADSPATPTSPG